MKLLPLSFFHLSRRIGAYIGQRDHHLSCKLHITSLSNLIVFVMWSRKLRYFASAASLLLAISVF